MPCRCRPGAMTTVTCKDGDEPVHLWASVARGRARWHRPHGAALAHSPSRIMRGALGASASLSSPVSTSPRAVWPCLLLSLHFSAEIHSNGSNPEDTSGSLRKSGKNTAA